VIAGVVLVDFATLFVLRNGLDSFNWWSFALVFFATLTFMAVNISNAVYFFRFARSQFSLIKNLLVPIAGVAVNVYLLDAAFFSSLWFNTSPTGRSVVIGSLAILMVELVVVAGMRLLAPQRFAQGAPLEADEGV
jgi:hypothetical protein